MGKDKNPPGGLDKTPMPPPSGDSYTLKLTFHSASNLPPADWGDSADPFILAQVNTAQPTRNKHDPHVRFRSATAYKTLDPKWESVWVVAGIPSSGAEFKVRVYDEDNGSHDDELGKVHVHTGRLSSDYRGLQRQVFDLSSRGASVKAWGRKALMKPFSHDARKDSTITISIENLGRTDPDVGKVYTANSFYWVHFSALLGYVTDTKAPNPDTPKEDPDFQANQLQLAGPTPNALYHRFVEFAPLVKTMFQGKHIRGKIMHELLHREHEKVYHFDYRTRYGTLRNGRERAQCFLDMANWGDGDRVFTYVVTLDGLLRFTETGPEFGIDMLSKHTMHSDVDNFICVSGEFFVRKYRRGDPDGDMVKGVTAGEGAKGLQPDVAKDIKRIELNTQYDGGDGDAGNGKEGERRGPMKIKNHSRHSSRHPSRHNSRRPSQRRRKSEESGYYTAEDNEKSHSHVPGAIAAVVPGMKGHRKSSSGGVQHLDNDRGISTPNAADTNGRRDTFGVPSQRQSYRDAAASPRPNGTSTLPRQNSAATQATITRNGNDRTSSFNANANGDRHVVADATATGSASVYDAAPASEFGGGAAFGSGALVPPLSGDTTMAVFNGAPIDASLKGKKGYIATRTVETELPNGRRIVETSRVEVTQRKGEPPQEHREFERHEISPKPRALPLPPDGQPDGPLSPKGRKASLPLSPGIGSPAPGSPGIASPPPGLASGLASPNPGPASGLASPNPGPASGLASPNPGFAGLGSFPSPPVRSPALSGLASPTQQPITIASAITPAPLDRRRSAHIEEIHDDEPTVKGLDGEAKLRDAKQSAQVKRPPSHASVHGSMHESMYENRASGASYDVPVTDKDKRQSTDRDRKERKSLERRKSDKRESTDAPRKSTESRRKSTDGRRKSLDRRRSDRKSAVQPLSPAKPTGAVTAVKVNGTDANANANGTASRPRSLAGPDHTYTRPGYDSDSGSSVEEDPNVHLHDAHVVVNGHPQSAFKEDVDVLARKPSKNRRSGLFKRLDKDTAKHQRNQPSAALGQARAVSNQGDGAIAAREASTTAEPLGTTSARDATAAGTTTKSSRRESLRVPLTAEALQHHNSIHKADKKHRISRDIPTTDADAIRAALIPPPPQRSPSKYKLVENPRFSPEKTRAGPVERPLLGAGGEPIGRVEEKPYAKDTMSLSGAVHHEYVERDPHGKTVGILTGPAIPSALELDSDEDIPRGGFLVYTNQLDGKPVEADPYGEKARKRAEAARLAAIEEERVKKEEEKAAEIREKERKKEVKREKKEEKKEEKRERKEEKRERKERERREKEERKAREREEREARERAERERKEQAEAIERERHQKEREQREKERAHAALMKTAELGDDADEANRHNGTRTSRDIGQRDDVGKRHEGPIPTAEPKAESKAASKASVAAIGEKPTNDTETAQKRKEKHVTPVETRWILGPEDGGSTDPSDYQLIIDNDSGTYRPDKQLMPLFEAWLRQEFPGLHIMAMSSDDDRLQSMKKKRHERKRERNKGRVYGSQSSSASSLSSSDEEDVKQGRAPRGKKEKGLDFIEHPGQTIKQHLHHDK